MDLLQIAINKARDLKHNAGDAGPLDDADPPEDIAPAPFVLQKEMLVAKPDEIYQAMPVYRLENK